MNRNEVTTLNNLVIGDRFYKQGDKKKDAMKVNDIKSRADGKIEHISICPSSSMNPSSLVTKNIEKADQYLVVFLRHENEIV